MPFAASAVTSGRVVRHGRFGSLTLTDALHPPKMEISLHAHPAAYITFVVEGSFMEIVDGAQFTCRAGDVLVKPVDSAHANRYGSEGARSFVVEIPSRVVSERRGGFHEVERARVFRDPRLTVLMTRIYEKPHAWAGPEARGVEEHLEELLARTARMPSWVVPCQPSRDVPRWLEDVYKRVRAEFREKPSLTSLARGASVHPDYLSRAFRDCFGSTIGHQVRRWRIEYAARDVRTTQKALSQIACDAGFADQSHMTRQMRRHLGVTPGALRAP